MILIYDNFFINVYVNCNTCKTLTESAIETYPYLLFNLHNHLYKPKNA